MARPHYDVAFWQTRETEEDTEIIIRTNNGRAFYCSVFPSEFRQSPDITAQYFKCLHLLRSGEEEIDDFYREDACDWLLQAFKPLVHQLSAEDDKLQPYRLENAHPGWCSPLIRLENGFVEGPEQWTRSYHPSDVELCYERSEDVLVKPPRRVAVEGEDTFFFKRPIGNFGTRHVMDELEKLKSIATADVPSDALICRLHGVVRDGRGVVGMIFPLIKRMDVLSKAKAIQATPSLRKRWAEQITYSLKVLHERGIVWGDAKAENILIDEDDNAWIIDFGGGYTVGWVDKEKAGTLDGDKQGLAKILHFLN